MPCDAGRANGPSQKELGYSRRGSFPGSQGPGWVRKAGAHLGSDTDFRYYLCSLGLTTVFPKIYYFFYLWLFWVFTVVLSLVGAAL